MPAPVKGNIMYYAIISEDVENSLPLRMQARPAHLLRVEALNADGRLVIAGPHPAIDDENPGDAGFSGSLIIASFESLAGTALIRARVPAADPDNSHQVPHSSSPAAQLFESTAS